MPGLASVNGRISPIEQATISILDRGFLFGDGAYEVIRVHNGRPFRLEAHLRRLAATCEGLAFAVVPDLKDLHSQCELLVRQSDLDSAALYLHVTRGVGRAQAHLADLARPTVVLCVEPPPVWPEKHHSEGIRVLPLVDRRWSGSSLKTTNLLARVLAQDAAHRAGAAEAVWVDPDGLVREGLSSNVFACLGDGLATPALGPHLLAGVTRSVILDIAATQKIPVTEGDLSLDDFLAAQEAFICSTTRSVMPVVEVGDSRLGNGRPGPRTRLLQSWYEAVVDRECGIGR